MAVLIAALLPALASAAISVNRTRLIITEKEREASPRIRNEGSAPVLIEAWVDAGDTQAQVERLQTPFIVDPPVFRLEPGQSRRVRVLMTRAPETLPGERESAFWFNVLEIPPKPDDRHLDSQLQISFQTRIKVFYRPRSIANHMLTPAEQLSFALKRDATGRPVLMIRNPSPLHRTISSLVAVHPNGAEMQLQPPMLAPGQVVELAIGDPEANATGPDNWQVHFSTIDDFGVEQHADTEVQPE